MRPTIKTLLLIIIALALCAAAYLWWRARGAAEYSLLTALVKRGDITTTIGATGTIEPLETVDVGAQVAGRIATFGKDKTGKPVDYGSIVEQGSLLAKIDDSVYAADLSVAKASKMSAQATLEQTRAKLAQADADWKRNQSLLAQKLLAQSDYDTSKANYEVARANVSIAESGVAQAEANLEIAQQNLNYCTINSPVDGVIIDRRVNVGQTVVASLNAPSLFLIARDLTKMQIWVSVNEADVGRVKPGAPVTFTVDSFPGRQFQGAVAKVRLNAQMTQNVVLYTVEINIDNPDLLLLPYLTANVRFQLDQATNTLIVPNAALRWTPATPDEISPDAHAAAGPSPATPATPDATATPAAANPSTENSNPKSQIPVATPAPPTRVLWITTADNHVRPIEVTAGLTDGVNTAITPLTPDALREGDEVVTGDLAGAPKHAKNPFLPTSTSRH